MVAVVSGNGLGLTNSSRALLGGAGSLGNGTSGRSGEQVYLNSATGNLVIQDRDEYLTGIGLRTPILRTYNSQGQFVDDNGDNWRLGVHQKLSPVSGTVNTAGSTITKTFGDGSEVVYTYNATLTRYVSTDGDGAHDTLSWNSGTSQWTWTDGSARATETYDSNGRLIQSRDQDNNLLTYNYNAAGLLTSITDSSTPQQTYFFDYTGTNLTAVRTVSNGVTQTLTRYTYDGQNRLSEVRVDLLPADNSIADGKVFLTTYTYDSTSKRVLSISQGNGVTVGSTVSFTYELLAGQHRVKTFTDAEGRVSTYNYTLPSGGGSTTVPANSGVLSTTEQQTTSNTYNLNTGALSGGSGVQYNQLFSDIPIENLSGTTGSMLTYRIEVPAGTSALYLKSEGGTGDAEMYLRYGQPPSIEFYDHISANASNDEMLVITDPTPGTWYVGMIAYLPFTNVRLMASVQTGTSSTQTLTPGTAVHDISGNLDSSSERMFSFNIPAGTSNFRVTSSGGNGDVDIYVRHGAPATEADYDDRGIGPDSNEVVTFTSPAAGTWYVLVKTWANTTDAHLVLHTNLGGTNTPPTAEAGQNRSVANGASVALTGTGSDAQGAVTYSWSQLSGPAVTLSGATTANASFTAPTVSTPATLVFRLRVTDSAGQTNDDIVRILVGAPATLPQPVNWSTPETLESTATAASQLLAGAGTAGAAVAVWQQGSTLYARTYTVATNTWSTAIAVSGSSTTPTAQKLYVDPESGNAILTWRDSANGEIRVNRYIASTGTWQGSELVATVAGGITVSDLTCSINGGNGRGGVVWLETNGTTKTLRIRRYTSTSWAAAETVTTVTGTNTIDTVQYIMNNSMRNQLVWRSSSGSGYIVNSRSYSGSWGSVVQINDAAAQVSQIRLDTDPTGNVNVFWMEGTQQIFHNWGGGASWNGANLILHAPSDIASYSASDNGSWSLAVVTTDNRVYAIYAADPGVGLYELYAGSAVSGVHVDHTTGGDVVVAWRDGNDVWAQRVVDGFWRGAQRLETASGAAAGTIYAFVNEDGAGVEDNEAVAIWRQNDGTADSIYFSRYTFDEPSAPGAQYYTVQAGDTWATIAQTLYGSSAAATELQTALGNPTLTTGLQLTGFPASLTVTTTTTVTVPAYYTVPAGATWTSVTQAIYGTSDANAVAALQAATGSPALTTDLHLTVPLNLTYSTGGGGTTTYLQTDLTDHLGFVTSFVNDASGRLTGVLSPTTGGNRLERRYTYDASGNVTSIVDDPTGLNRITTLQYDTNGNLTLTRDSFGNTVTRTYSSTNQLLTETSYTVPDPDGGGSGQPSGALTTRYAYDSEDHLRYVVSADGRVTEHRYNGNGTRSASIQYTDAVYDITALSATTAITLAQLDTWAGARTLTLIQLVAYTYDFRGNVSTRTAYTTTTSGGAGVVADSSLTRFVYDQRGQLISSFEARAETTTDATDFVTNYTYDGLGRLLSTVQWMSSTDTRSTVTVYDDVLNKTTVTLANGLVTASTYDKSGNLISVVNSGPSLATGTTNYTYDAGGRLRFLTNNGQRQFRLYDEAGRHVASIDVDGTLTEYIYDRANQRIKTIVYSDRVPSTTLASLVDVNDRPTNVTLPTVRSAITSIVGRNQDLDQVSRAVYDSAGRLEYAIDEIGAVTRYVYDGAGRLKEEVQYATLFSIPRATDQVLPSAVTPATSVDDRRTRHFYDNAGNRLGTLDAAGYLIENTYDAAGRLTRQLRYATATLSTIRLTGTLAELRPALDNTVTTESPERDITTYFFYDGQGRRTGELDAEGYLTETSYNVAGLVSQKVRYNQVLTYSAGATLASLKGAVLPASTRQTITFAYDNVGRLQRETNHENTATAYAYDKVDHLTSTTRAADTPEARTTQTRYDALGRVIAELTAQGSAQITVGMTPTQIDAVWNQYSVRYAYDAAGRRLSATDQNNNVTLFYYDVDGRLTHTVNALGEVEQTRYNALGQATEVIRYSNRISTATLTGGLVDSTLSSRVSNAADETKDAKTTLLYSLRGEVERTTTVENAVTSHLYNAFGEEKERTQWIDATRFLTHQYKHDTLGQLKETRWDPSGLNTVETYEYDAFGRQTRTTDANGNVRRAIYDRLGRTIQTVEPLTGNRFISYDAFSRKLTTTDALGNITNYDHDTALTVIVTTQEGVSFTTVSNRHGQTATVTDARLNLTTYNYDANGQVQSIVDSVGTQVSNTYDRAGRMLTTTDARGTVTTFAYDAADRVFTRTVDSVAGGLALVTTHVYDGQGRIVDITDPDGRLTRTSYDEDGRVIQVAIDPAGLNLRTSYAYDRSGHTITVTEGVDSAMPRRTQYKYDNLGRRTEEIVDPTELGGTLNLRTQYRYDANGNLTRKIDPSGNSTWYVYDAASRLQYTVNALGGVKETVYDAEHRVTATRNYANAIPTTSFGNVVTSITVGVNAADQFVESVYDRDGREVFTINALGGVTRRDYDPNGNVVRVRTYLNALLATTPRTVTAISNALVPNAAADREFRTVYDARNRATFTIDASGAVRRRQYDGGGNVVAVTQFAVLRTAADQPDDQTMVQWAQANGASGDRTTRTWYDAANRQVFVLDAENYLRETRHDTANRRVQEIVYVDHPPALASMTASQIRQSAFVAALDPNRDQVTTTEYDIAGRIHRIYDATYTSSQANYQQYGYDAVGNRTSYRNAKGSVWTYEYDANRRMIFERSEPVQVATVTESGGALSIPASVLQSIVTNFQYDALGNLRFRTEAHGTGQARTTEYLYDALGRQYRTNFPEVDVYDAPADSVTRAGAAVVREEREADLFTEVTFDALGNATRNIDVAGKASYKVYDVLGRVRYEIDALRHVVRHDYDEFGNEKALVRYANALASVPAFTDNRISESTMATAAAAIADSTRDRTIASTYDRLDRVVSVAQPSVLVFAPNASAAGGRSFPASPTTFFLYNAFGEVIRESRLVDTLDQLVVNPTTSMTQNQWAHDHYYYDRRGLKIGQIDAMGYLTTFEHDETGDVTRQLEYAQARQGWNTTGYGTVGTPDPTAGLDREVWFTYDRLNRLVTEQRRNVQYTTISGGSTSPVTAHLTTTYGYDLLGNRISVTDPTNATTYTYYDVLGRVRAIAEPSRDANGVSTSSTDFLIPLVTMRRDVFGNVVEETRYARGATSANSTDFVLAGTDSKDRTTKFQFDDHGHVTRTTDAIGADRRASYDERGALAKEWQHITNADGVLETLVTIHEYDALGRETAVVEPQKLGTSNVVVRTETSFNAFGEVVTKGIDGGQQEKFEYDQAGRIWRTNSGDGVYKVFLYDLAGNATLEIRSRTGNLATIASAAAARDLPASSQMRTETRYDLLGRVVEQRQPTFTTTSGLQPIVGNFQIGDTTGPVNPRAVYQLVGTGPMGEPIYVLNPTATLAAGGGYILNADGSYTLDPTHVIRTRTRINWDAPAEAGVTAKFEYRLASSSGAYTEIVVGYLAGNKLSADVSSLMNQDYVYRITYIRAGESVAYAQATGTFRINGTLSTTITPAADPPDPAREVATLASTHAGGYLRWAIPSGAPVTVAFTYTAPGGNPTSRSVATNGSNYEVDLRFLPALQSGQSYTYQITYSRGATVVGQATGTFTTPGIINNRSVSSTHSPASLLPDAQAVAPLSGSAGASVGARIVDRAFQAEVPEPPPQEGDRYVWQGTNRVDLVWSTLSTSNVRVVLDIMTDGRYFASSVPVQLDEQTFSNASTGVSFTWETTAQPTSPQPGGIDRVTRVRVYNSASGVLLLDQSNPPVNIGKSLSWNAPTDGTSLSDATFEYAVHNSGSYQTRSIVTSGPKWTVDITSLSPALYDYRVTYKHGNRTVAISTGTFNVANGSTTSITTASVTPSSAPPASEHVSAVSGVNGAAVSAFIADSEVAQPIVNPRSVGWQGGPNIVNLTWGDLGPGAIRVEMDYLTQHGARWVNDSEAGWQFEAFWFPPESRSYPVQSFASGATGGTISWLDPNGTFGGITQVTAVRVFKETSPGVYTLVVSSSTPQPPSLTWNAPSANVGLVRFYWNQPGVGWTQINTSLSGGQRSVNLGSIPNGSYGFRVVNHRAGDNIEMSRAEGTLTRSGSTVSVSGVSHTILAPSWISGVTHSGPNVTWTQAPSGATVTFEYLSNTTWIPRSHTVSGSTYSVDMSGIATGGIAITRQYRILYTLSGTVTHEASGNVTLTPSTSTVPPSVTVTPVTDDFFPSHLIPVSASGDTITWTAPPGIVAGDTLFIRYSINGSSPIETTTATGALSKTFTDLPEGSSTVTYTIWYFHAGQTQPYARAIGSLAATVTITPIMPTITVLSQAPVFPSGVQTIAQPVHDSGQKLGWGPLTNATAIVSFSYESAPGTWTPLTVSPRTASSGYEVNLAEVPLESFRYSISYKMPSATNPYALGSGLITIVRTANVTSRSITDTTSGSQTPQLQAPSMSQLLDRWGNVIRLTNTAQKTTDYTYDQNSQLLETKQPQVQVVSTTGTVGFSSERPTSQNYYDAMGRLIATRDANGRLNRVVLNAAGQTLEEVHADGGVKRFVNDIFGNQVMIHDERNFRTRNTYDRVNQLTNVERDVVAGGLESTSTADGIAIRESYAYDEAGRRKSETNGEGETTRYFHDLLGNVVTRRSPMGRVTSFEYDQQGRKTRETDPILNFLTWTYDYFGHLLTHRDLGGIVTTYAPVDQAGLLTNQTNTAGQSITYDYNAGGHLITVTEASNATQAATAGLANVNRTTEYAYDSAGRRAREQTTIDGRKHQDTRIEYDDAGRISKISDLRYQTTYSYDAQGNRTRIQATYFDHQQIQRTQDLWYTYDAMNRVLVSQGVNVGGTITVNQSQGIRLEYNLAGQRTRAYQYGKAIETTSRTIFPEGIPEVIPVYKLIDGFSTEDYTYDGAGRHTTTTKDNKLINDRQYDDASRETWDYTGYVPSAQADPLKDRQRTTVYNDDSQMITQTTREGAANRLESVVTYNIDAAGVLRSYVLQAYDPSVVNPPLRYTSTYTFGYRSGETYQETTQTVASSGTGAPGPGSTERRYNVNGELVAFLDNNDTPAAPKDRYFANNIAGQALTIVRGNYTTTAQQNQAFRDALNRWDNTVKAQHFFSALGQSTGSFGQLQDASGAFKANFDVNYTPVSNTYPADTPSEAVVQQGETLRHVAARVFGDSNLWYIIAQENGLADPNAELESGTILRIPNEVISLSNASSTFKPFNFAEAVGDTTPTQPMPPPPKKKGCGLLGQIFMLAVSIVATVLTGGLLGSAISQGIAIATGIQDKFDWKALALGAIGTAAATGVTALADGASKVGKVLQSIGTAGRAVVTGIVTQGIGVVTGLQSSFSWREIAIGAVASPLVKKASEYVGGKVPHTSPFLNQLASSAAGAVTGAAVRASLGGRVDVVSVLTDTFGNAIGNSIVSKLSPDPMAMAGTAIAAADELNEVQVTAQRIPTDANGYPLSNNSSGVALAESMISPDEQREMQEVLVTGERIRAGDDPSLDMWFDLHTTRWMYSEAGQKLIHQMGGWAGENYRTAQRFLHPSAYYTNKMASAYDALTGAKPGTGLSQLGYAYGGDGWLKGEYLSGGIKSAVDFVVAGTAGMFTTMALQPDPILATVDPTTFERLRANAALEGDATFRALSWAPTSLDQQEAYGYGMRAQGATTLALGAYGLVRAGAGAAAGAFRTESVVSFDAASASASFQGRYPYYGIDELVNTSLPEGSLVVQVTHSVDGVPVSSYFTRVESLDAAALPGGGFDANALNQGLQTFPGRREAFRPYAQIYQVAEDIPFGGAATGPTTANPYFNPGHYRGLDQVFILPELQSNLRPTVRYELQNTRTPTYTPIDEVINNMLRQDTN